MHYFKSVLATGLLSLLIIGCKKEAPLTKTNLQSAEQDITISGNIPGKISGKVNGKENSKEDNRVVRKTTDKGSSSKPKNKYADSQQYFKHEGKLAKIRSKFYETGKSKIDVQILPAKEGTKYTHTITRHSIDGSKSTSTNETVDFFMINMFVKSKSGKSNLTETQKLDMVDFAVSSFNGYDFVDKELAKEYSLIPGVLNTKGVVETLR